MAPTNNPTTPAEWGRYLVSEPNLRAELSKRLTGEDISSFIELEEDSIQTITCTKCERPTLIHHKDENNGCIFITQALARFCDDDQYEEFLEALDDSLREFEVFEQAL